MEIVVVTPKDDNTLEYTEDMSHYMRYLSCQFFGLNMDNKREIWEYNWNADAFNSLKHNFGNFYHPKRKQILQNIFGGNDVVHRLFLEDIGYENIEQMEFMHGCMELTGKIVSEFEGICYIFVHKCVKMIWRNNI